jgi:hypothetical protein
MTPRSRLAALAAALSIVLAACGSTVTPTRTPAGSSGPPATGSGALSVLPVEVSSELAVGPNRIVFSLVDPTGQKSVAGPDRTFQVGFTGPSGESIPPAPLAFIWAIEGVSGVYVGHATFASAGKWTANVTTSKPGATTESMPFGFDVVAKSQVVWPGDAAPSVNTPTLADVGGDVAKISSDSKPLPAFYQTSEADALAAHKPFVLIFATPKFCQTATCGPTLDRLKPVATAHPEMTFINVEPYKLQFADGELQPILTASNLTPVDATIAFKLSSEPYVFVVGADGKVSASFELVFSPDEIEAAIKQVEAAG